MRISPFILLTALLLPLFACTRQEPLPDSPVPAPQPGSRIPGTAIIQLSEQTADHFAIEDYPDVAAALGVISAERVFPDAGEFEARHRAAGLHRWYSVRYDEAVSPTKAREGLGALEGVEAIDFPRRKVRRGFFNDRYLADQWHFVNDGSLGAIFKRGIDINVEPVWREFTGGTRDVIVAIIDGGIDLKHNDLAGVVLPAGDNGSRNFVPGYPPNTIPADDHATHAGGIIGAINNNGFSCSGIAGGLDGTGGVRLMSCVIFESDEDSRDTDSGDEARALVWAADHGAVIANNSWGYEFDTEEEARKEAIAFENEPSSIKSAIDYFIANAGLDADGNQTGPMRGGLVVFASGNYGWNHDVPSEYAPIVSVGAFGPDGKMPRYSNYGPWVDILAPGGSDTDDQYAEWIVSLATNQGAAYMVGTSMAAPHVSGVAALLVSYFGGPGFTNDDLKERLLESARYDVIDLQGRSVGGGMLDAYAAFQYNLTPVDPSKADIRFISDYAGDYRFKAHETVSLGIIIRGNERLKLPVRFDSDCPGASATCSSSSAQIQIVAPKAPAGEYTGILRVGTIASYKISFTILENHAPAVVKPLENQIVNAASASIASIDLSQYFQDPDGEQPTYKISLTGDDLLSARLSGSILSLTPDGYGQAEVTVTATDALQASCSSTFQLLARNTYQDLDVFPNPVSDVLNVRPGSDTAVQLALYNGSGACVISRETQAGPFQPVRLDVKALPAGVYVLKLSYGSKQQTVTIVKY